jgi:hypothetical protein
LHTVCGLPVACDFSDDGSEHEATHLNIDYIVCQKHSADADNNISNRTYPL